MEQTQEPQIIYSSYTESQKKASKKWRENNLDHVKEHQKNYSKIYYENKKEQIRKKNLERYYKKKEQKIQNLQKIENVEIVV
jgi:hypothetical protein